MEIEAGAGAPASDADGRHARAGATLELQDTKTSSSAEHGGGRRAPAPVSCRRRGVGRGAGRCRELSKTFVRLLKSGVGVSTGTRISVFIFLLAGIYRTHTKQVPFGGTVQPPLQSPGAACGARWPSHSPPATHTRCRGSRTPCPAPSCNGAAWCSTAWCSTAWCSTAWCSTAWCSMVLLKAPNTACDNCEAGKYSAALGVYLLATYKHTCARKHSVYLHACVDVIHTRTHTQVNEIHPRTHTNRCRRKCVPSVRGQQVHGIKRSLRLHKLRFKSDKRRGVALQP